MHDSTQSRVALTRRQFSRAALAATGLAPLRVRELFGVIRELSAGGLTIMLVEQNVASSLRLADTAHVLEAGRIVLSGSGMGLLEDASVRQAYLGL